MEDLLVPILVPIFCGCVLPIMVVLITSMRKKNSDNKRAEILIKAIESGKDVDADKLAEALGKPRHSPLEILNARLLRGCIYSLVGLALIFMYCIWPDHDKDFQMLLIFMGAISTAVGIAYLIVYFMTRGQIRDEKE